VDPRKGERVMAQTFLATNTPYTFVWHDNAGQSIPDHTKEVSSRLRIDGLTINIGDNVKLNEPIIIINSGATKNNSINRINIGVNSKVQIIEYLMADDQNCTNTVSTSIHCEQGSKLQHCILQQARNKTEIKQSSTTNIYQAAYSHVVSNIFSFGGKTSHVELGIALQGTNAECLASCLAYTNGDETQQVLLKIDHEHETCNSKSIARGVLKDKSITDFIGRITVHPNAKKSIAELQIKNLLCSPKAQALNHPELEIYNDDVRCSHGSSTGQLDEDALFYMRSRGIDLNEATAMLISGFIKPSIESCPIPLVAEYIRNLVLERKDGSE
jgi:Fe-S cluster assembly protein SufD